jgi:hypothetical protein
MQAIVSDVSSLNFCLVDDSEGVQLNSDLGASVPGVIDTTQ